MNWEDCQILNLDSVPESHAAATLELKHSQLLLEWMVDNSFFKSEVFEGNIDISGQTFYRFSITATDSEEVVYNGFGRSKNRLQAASIAAGEVIERYAAKRTLKSTNPFLAKHLVTVSDAEISISAANEQASLPSAGFHSSNGWAVHFSLKTAIEKSVIESLERHTLLYSYLHSGWDGFSADNQVPFQGKKLTPYVSRFGFGGFSAGIVATEGEKLQGRTFGYLCDDSEVIHGSQKWLGAFFESYGQWESIQADSSLPENVNYLEKYQRHFVDTPHPHQSSGPVSSNIKNVSDVIASIVMFDLQKVLNLPVPMFAAFSFGGDLIPLFFKQKLSELETKSLMTALENWELSTDLPEVHPIL